MRPYPFAEYHTCVLRLTLNTVYLNYPPRIRTLALTLTLTRTRTLTLALTRTRTLTLALSRTLSRTLTLTRRAPSSSDRS